MNIYCILHRPRSLCSFKPALLTQPNAEGNVLGLHQHLRRPDTLLQKKRRSSATEGATMTNQSVSSLVAANANDWRIQATTAIKDSFKKWIYSLFLHLQQWRQAFQGRPEKSLLSKNSAGERRGIGNNQSRYSWTLRETRHIRWKSLISKCWKRTAPPTHPSDTVHMQHLSNKDAPSSCHCQVNHPITVDGCASGTFTSQSARERICATEFIFPTASRMPLTRPSCRLRLASRDLWWKVEPDHTC